jgi:DNA-binding beta-propeller fold protein YncE
MLCGHPEPDKRMQGRSAVYKHPMSDARIGSEVAGYRIVSVLGQLDRAVGTVSVVDPRTLTVDATVRLGDEEQSLVFGAGAVWLADGPATTLSRIDPVTRELTAYPMAGPVVDVAVDQDTGALWVLISDSGDSTP